MAENGELFNGLVPSKEELGLPTPEEAGDTVFGSGEPDAVDRAAEDAQRQIANIVRKPTETIIDTNERLDQVSADLESAKKDIINALGLGSGDDLLALVCYPLEMLEYFLAEALQKLLRKKASIQRVAEQLENIRAPTLPDISGLLAVVDVDAGMYDKIREACPSLGLPNISGGVDKLRESLAAAYNKLADALDGHPFSFLGTLIGLLDDLVSELINAITNFIVGHLGRIGSCLCKLCGTAPCGDDDGTTSGTGTTGEGLGSNIGALLGADSFAIWEGWKGFLRENGDDPFRWADSLTVDQRGKLDEVSSIQDRLRSLARTDVTPSAGQRNVTAFTPTSTFVRRSPREVRDGQVDEINAAIALIEKNEDGPGFIYTEAIRLTRETAVV